MAKSQDAVGARRSDWPWFTSAGGLMRCTSKFLLTGSLLLPSTLGAEEAMTPEVVVSQADCYEYSPQAAYNSLRDEYLVVWELVCSSATPVRQVRARRLDRYGRPLATAFDVGPAGDTRDRGEPAITYDLDHDRWLVAYIYDYWGDGSDWDLRARFLDWDGTRPDWAEFTVQASGLDELEPTVAYDELADKFLIAWRLQDLATWSRIWGAAFVFGAVPSPFAIADAANREQPDAAYEPFADRFVVAYDSVSDVFAKRVDPTGSAEAELPLGILPELEFYPATANCRNWQNLVVWQWQFATGDFDVLGQFLYGSGALDGGNVLVSGSSFDETNVDVACRWGGTDYLIAHEATTSFGTSGVFGRRIATTKILRSPFPVRAPGTGEAGLAFNPTVAGGRAGWLVAWEHLRGAGGYNDIHARVVWDLFADGFEWGSTANWSAVSP